ncbi:MAG: ElyC/SanA/YdcF family protein [Oscillospiraceae bacterium]|nr:ElyC/SanA/YdcF family protein [Oscillospiraceae bacterium]
MKLIKKLTAAVLAAAAVCAVLVFGIDFYVKQKAKPYILTPEEAGEGYDCVLVLGCGVWGDTPSHMLEDRLLEGISLCQSGASKKLLMSGDHGREGYDEVNVMKKFAVDRGIPSEDVFMDHAGFSTYESMYRAKEIFKAEKILIVTQDYHLYRAIYDARALGLEAYGVASNPRSYGGQLYRDIREILARNKDFIYSIIKPEPTYLGEAIPVQGNGNLTND